MRTSVFTGLTLLLSLNVAGLMPALAQQPQVVAWGVNTFGQTNVPVGIRNVVAIKAGHRHALALLRNGTVMAWGNNGFGETNVPPEATNIVALAAGSGHSIALRADGTVVGWGLNGYMQTNIPPDWTNIVAISGSIAHYLALRADGTVLGVGDNSFGEATASVGLNNVVQVAAGGHYSMALKADGTVVGWGRRFELETNGLLGFSNVVALDANAECFVAKVWDNSACMSPVMYGSDIVPTVFASNITAVAAGYSHVLYLSQDGSVVSRQVGINTNVINEWTNVVAVSGGDNFSLALIGDGPPFITSPMINRTMNLGAKTFFCTAASGALPLSYQWRINGTNLPDATNVVLVLENLQLSQAGGYSVQVSNVFGVVTSPEAWLTVSSNVVSSKIIVGEKPGKTGRFDFSFPTQPGIQYLVEWRNQLPQTNNAPWETLSNLIGSGYVAPVFDPDATNFSRVYRVRTP